MQDATRSLACVTRLCQLTSPQLLLSLWPIALRIGRLIQRFRNQPRSPQAMHDFEVELLRLLIEMGRRIVEWTLNSLSPERHLMPGELFYQNDHYRLKGLSPTRNLNCLFGKIRVWRWLYEGTEGLGLPALFPLQMELGILAGVATPALADRVGQLAAELTQRQCLDVLRQQHHVVWGTETLRKVTAGMAEAMSPFRHQVQVDQVLAWLKQAAAEGGPRKILLSVGRDGVMLPIRSFKKYREGAAATVSVFNRHGKRLGTVYLGQMPEAGQVTLSDELTCLLKDILAGWDGPPLRLVFVTDAGFHCREYFEQVLCRMPDPLRAGKFLPWEWVVDYYHACQYITKLGEAIFGKGREARAWAAKMRRWLKEKPGGVYRVLRSAGALPSIRGLVGDESDYDDGSGYLRRHAGSMDYRRLRRLRSPIGSGITEAACKIVFTQRFKQAGMKWNIADGGSILALRVISLSKLWSAARDAMYVSYNKAQRPVPRQIYKNTMQNAA